MIDETRTTFRRVSLTDDIPGHLYLTSMPGKSEPIQVFKRTVDELSIHRVVCLAFYKEIEKSSPDYFQLIKSETYNWQFEYFPIPDMGVHDDLEGVPEDRDAFLDLAKNLAKLLKEGENILIHCYGGIGRTGTLASVILMMMGINHDDVVARVKRADAHPVTRGQIELIRSVVKELTGD